MDQQSLLFQAMVYLAAAVVMVPLAKKLGLGSVLGYLLAGVVIGPAVTGFIGNEGQDIMHFAEFGVVMMLFIIGLELEPKRLWKLRKSIAGLGTLQVLATGLAIAGLAMAFGLPWKQALALGMIMSLSSTAIVLQTLNEKGLMNTAAGQSSFSVLLFQDIAVIPMLALFPLLVNLPDTTATESGHTQATLVDHLSGWGKTLVVLVTVGMIILSGRFLVRPLFRVIAATKLREIFTATALLLVIGIAVLMMQVGLSPALGAFLAGVVLADSEYRHELESDIEPFKGLLLGLFFIAVGASIDFQLIVQEPGFIVGAVLVLMAIKGIVLIVLGKTFGLKRDQNLQFAVSLCQIGEFAFVLLSFSLQQHILPASVTDRLVAVVAISMALTPLMMLMNEQLVLPFVGARIRQHDNQREADAIEERNPVIVAGFGHFGNTVGRFLRANGVKATYLDNDSDRVELLRKMGFKIHYGDASRYDLLQAAGAEHAKVIVIAIDSPEKRLEMIETVKKHFSHLHMFVRARNRYDAYDLMNAGMLHVYRETIDTSLRLGQDVLSFLGYRAYKVHRAAQTFLKYDEQVLKELASIRDGDEYIIASRSHMEELDRLLQADQQKQFTELESGWGEESLIAEANKPSP
jgi:transporter, monovalent cation:proton antiporter-2 (CPA2) family